MPNVFIHLLKPTSSLERKRKLVKAITEALVTHIGSQESAIRITIVEQEMENVAFGSRLVCDTDLGRKLKSLKKR